MRCRTAEQRIRSGGKSEECTALEVNAEAPRNPGERLRCIASSGAKQAHRLQPSPEHGELHGRPAARLGTGTKPCPCSNRDFGWTDHRAWNRSTAYSADLASSPTRSPQIAGPTRPPTLRR